MGSSKTAKNPASLVLLLLLGKLWLTRKVDFPLAYIQQREEVADVVLQGGLATASHKEYQYLLQSEKGFAISQSPLHVSSHCNMGWSSFLSPFAPWHTAYPWTPQQAFLPPGSPPCWWVDNLQFLGFERQRELYHETQTRLINNTKCAVGCFHSLHSCTATRASATLCLPICCWWTTKEISWDSRKGPSGTFSLFKVCLSPASISFQWLPVLACSLQPRTSLGTELALHHTKHMLSDMHQHKWQNRCVDRVTEDESPRKF